MKEVLLKKPTAFLADVSGKIPTPTGSLDISWDHAKGSLQLNVPKQMKVKLELRSFGGSDKLQFLRGKANKVTKDYTILSSGVYELTYANP